MPQSSSPRFSMFETFPARLGGAARAFVREPAAPESPAPGPGLPAAPRPQGRRGPRRKSLGAGAAVSGVPPGPAGARGSRVRGSRARGAASRPRGRRRSPGARWPRGVRRRRGPRATHPDAGGAAARPPRTRAAASSRPPQPRSAPRSPQRAGAQGDAQLGERWRPRARPVPAPQPARSVSARRGHVTQAPPLPPRVTSPPAGGAPRPGPQASGLVQNVLEASRAVLVPGVCLRAAFGLFSPIKTLMLDKCPATHENVFDSLTMKEMWVQSKGGATPPSRQLCETSRVGG